MKEQMVKEYEKYSKADSYVFGFARRGRVFAVKASFEKVASLTRECSGSSSRGGYQQVRIYISSLEQALLIANGQAEDIGAEEELSADKRYNKGVNFERMVVESYGLKWQGKDKVPFWVAGDFEVNGKQVQVKFQGAELTNERALQSAKAAC